jgi:hypothetical protein
VGIRHRRRQPSGRGAALAGAWTAEAGIAQSVPGVAANRAGAESAVADDNDGDEVPGLGAWLDQRCDEGDAGEGAAACRVPLRPARALREPGDSFLYTLKAGLRAAARGGRSRAGNDTTGPKNRPDPAVTGWAPPDTSRPGGRSVRGSGRPPACHCVGLPFHER